MDYGVCTNESKVMIVPYGIETICEQFMKKGVAV